MKPTKVQQEIRKMRFEEAYEGWTEGRLTQAEAARILGVCERSFRRYMWRYEAEGLDGLIDRRLEQASNRQAPVDEVMALTDEYRRRYLGWNAKHFHSWYTRTGGTRSYTWVKRRLQEAERVPRLKKRGTHRKRRERSALPGMMIHQSLPPNVSIGGRQHPRMGGRTEVGLDRDTQFGRALRHLGIEMIAAYSPEARGRSERAFGTHQGRLPFELAAANITHMETANRYLREVYLPAFNAEFACPAAEQGSAFVPWIGGDLRD